jgi:hypothetical protein
VIRQDRFVEGALGNAGVSTIQRRAGRSGSVLPPHLALSLSPRARHRPFPSTKPFAIQIPHRHTLLPKKQRAYQDYFPHYAK